MSNYIAYTALAILTNLLSGLGGTVPKYFGVGSGSGAASRSVTALSTEEWGTNNDGTHNTRISGTVSRTTTSQTNDTYSVVATFTAAAGNAPVTIKNAALFDTAGTAANLTTAPSGGNLFVISDGLAVTLNSGDSLQGTFLYQLT